MSALDRFTILQRLGTGGMAEVFKCRQSGIGGFEKLVVIKRILPHLVEDQAFVSMFLDEGRIAANLSHPNIVQVFEIAVDPRGVPYIVMEYVRGPSLAQLAKQAALQQRLDLRHVARLVAGAARGLHHAHLACDAEGRPLHIIHRDISLQNILVTLDGLAKVADFGVARADGRITHTQSGVVKGKVRYTAPEVLVDPDHGVQPRSDVFSLGVCLYVATTGQYPFSGANDLKVMEAIHDGRYPRPSSHRPGFPPELEQLIDWLLERDPERRCPSALAAAERLQAWLSASDGSSEAELAGWIAGLAPELATGTPPPPPVETATPEALESVDVLFSDVGTSALIRQRRGPLLWVLSAIAVLTMAMGWALNSARTQAHDALRADEERAAWLDEAARQLDAGRLLRAEELLRKTAALPNASTPASLRLTQLEADLRFARAVAATESALQVGDLTSADAMIKSLLLLDPADARVQSLSRQRGALAAARAPPPDPVAELKARGGDDAGSELEPPALAARAMRVPTRKPHLEAESAELPAPSAEPVEAPPVVEPLVANPPEAPVKRARARLVRTPGEGAPGLRVTASARAQVFLDGLPIGWTPLDLKELAATTHLVMAWAEGYESVTERVVVGPGEHIALDFPLRRAEP